MASTKPLLTIHTIWHPTFTNGSVIAQKIFDHFRRELYQTAAGGVGLSVLNVAFEDDACTIPSPIDPTESQATAAIVIIEDNFADDNLWVEYLHRLTQAAKNSDYRMCVFPVSLSTSALRKTGTTTQALRLHELTNLGLEEKLQILLSSLSYELCRLMRAFITRLEHPDATASLFQTYLEKVNIFLSHSKHDDHGISIVKSFRDYLHNNTDLSDFFDVRNIPIGMDFAEVLEHFVRVSAVVAIQTDSYSSREWCRREIIEAKYHNVPIVIASCLTNIEERGFPYIGNVPFVRMEPNSTNRIPLVVGRLLDEVLKDFIWRSWILLNHGSSKDVVFLPRAPELITLAALARNVSKATTVVYPDPPIGIEEIQIIETLASSVQFRSYTEWAAGI